MGRKVGIFGVASPAVQGQLEGFFPPDLEVWAVNEAHRHLPSGITVSRMFQLHVRDWREAERRYLYSKANELPPGLDPDCFGRDNAHVAYLRTCGVPVYGQVQWPDIPTSVRYPFEEVGGAVGIALPPYGNKRVWATSSFGYMAALLITEHLRGETVEQVYLYGVDLPIGTQRERVWEWPNFAYYLGVMTGMGIDVVLPPVATSLLSAPYYALGGHPYPGEADHWHLPGQSWFIWDGDDGVYRLGTWSQEPEGAAPAERTSHEETKCP